MASVLILFALVMSLIVDHLRKIVHESDPEEHGQWINHNDANAPGKE